MCAQPTTADLTNIPVPLEDMGDLFADLGQHVMASKQRENQVLAQSAIHGGPSTIQEALMNKLERAGMGMRVLAFKTGIKRKLLLSMLQGRVDIPADAQLAIINVLEDNMKKPKKTRYG